MKRTRVEEAPMRLVKRAVSGSDEAAQSGAQWECPEADRQNTDRENGIAFINMAKETLKDEVEVYDSFVRVMTKYKRGIIGERELIRRIKVLFKKYPGLIIGFNVFLEPCNRIDVPTEDEVDVEKLKTALRYVNKVKVRFTDAVNVYRDFLDILRAFKVGFSVKDVHENVTNLFRDHEDLLIEFQEFLPPRNWVSLVASVVQQSKVAPLPSALNEAQDNCQQQPDPAAEERHAEPLRPESRKLKVATQEQSTEHKWCDSGGRKAAADGSVKEPTAAGSVQGEAQYDRSGVKVESNGVRSRGEPHDETDGKERFHNRRRQKKPKLAVVESAPRPKRRRKSKAAESKEASQLAFFETLSRELEGGSVYRDFLQSMNLCKRQIITSSQLDVLIIEGLRGYPMLQKTFRKCFPSNRKDPDLILERWQECTPSYRLHDDWLGERPSVSADSQSQDEESDCGPYSTEGVLNNTWVTLTTGGNAFTAQESNRYEEILFKCEDQQYELDLLVETTKNTIARLGECIEMLLNPSGAPFDLDEHLTSIHLRCIERVFNPIYPTLMVHTHRHPLKALPVIKCRLEQRLKGWEARRKDWDTFWSRYRLSYHSKALVYLSDVELEDDDENDDDDYEQSS